MRASVWKAGLMALALGVPAGASGAKTCAESYLLCLNEASQAESGVTWKELGCLRTYGSCLKNQAFGG